MAWQDVTPVLVPEHTGSRRITLRVSATRGACLSLSAAIVAELGWTIETHLRLQLGHGEVAGKLRLVSDRDGPLRLVERGVNLKRPTTTKRGVYFLLRLGRWPGLPGAQLDSAAVDYDIAGQPGKHLTITLPLALVPPAVRAA